MSSGPRVELLKEAVEDDRIANDTAEGGVGPMTDESRDSSLTPDQQHISGPLPPCPDADRRIPPAWRTVDRVLDVRLIVSRHVHKKGSRAGGRGHRKVVNSGSADDEPDDAAGEELDEDARKELDDAFILGEQPRDTFLEPVEAFEKRVGRKLGICDIGKIAWAFFKWDDLGYEEGW